MDSFILIIPNGANRRQVPDSYEQARRCDYHQDDTSCLEKFLCFGSPFTRFSEPDSSPCFVRRRCSPFHPFYIEKACSYYGPYQNTDCRCHPKQEQSSPIEQNRREMSQQNKPTT